MLCIGTVIRTKAKVNLSYPEERVNTDRSIREGEENGTVTAEDIKGEEAKIRSGKHLPRNNQCFAKVN